MIKMQLFTIHIVPRISSIIIQYIAFNLQT